MLIWWNCTYLFQNSCPGCSPHAARQVTKYDLTTYFKLFTLDKLITLWSHNNQVNYHFWQKDDFYTHLIHQYSYLIFSLAYEEIKTRPWRSFTCQWRPSSFSMWSSSRKNCPFVLLSWHKIELKITSIAIV